MQNNIVAVAVTSTSSDSDALVAADPSLRVHGISICESAGSSDKAHFRLIHGATAAGGTMVASIKLAASESQFIWFGDEGVRSPNGISVDRVAGTAEFIVYYSKVGS